MSFQALNSVRRNAGSSSRDEGLFPDLLEKSRMEIQRILPKHLDSDRMMWLALSSFRLNPKLAECDPLSVLAAVVQASQMGLAIGLNGEAYLVPFKRECQLIPGYQGLMKLARESGFVDDIYAMEVYERDTFEIDYGANRKLVHKPHAQSNGFPASNSERGNLVGFYAVAALASGESAFIHLAKRDCEDVRDSSSGYRYAKSNGVLHPWITEFTEMGKKTVIRKLTKHLPKSPNLSLALNLDSMSHEGLKQRITLQQAADGTYVPTPAHFKGQAEGDDGSQQPPQRPAPSPRPPERHGVSQQSAQGESQPQQWGTSQGSRYSAPPSRSAPPVSRAPAQPASTAQRPASPSRQPPVAAPTAQRAGTTNAAPAAMPQSSKEEVSLKAAATYLEKMRKAPSMDRVNDIYIEAEDSLSGAGLEAVNREYMVQKEKHDKHGTRQMFG